MLGRELVTDPRLFFLDEVNKAHTHLVFAWVVDTYLLTHMDMVIDD